MNSTDIFGDNNWWDKAGAFATLHHINPLRLQLLEQMAEQLNGKRLLDWGCGGGIFSESAAQHGAEVIGHDTNPTALTAAREHAEQNQVKVEYMSNPDNLPLSSFDLITCFEVLEHVASPASLVATIAPYLKKDGTIIFSTINRVPPAWLTMLLGLEILTKSLPPGTHDYRQFIKPRELSAMCRDSGLKVVDVIGLQYSFFGKYYYLESTPNPINYFMIAKNSEAI